MELQALLKIARGVEGRDSALHALVRACGQIARRVGARRSYVIYSSDSDGQGQLGASKEIAASPMTHQMFGEIIRRLMTQNALLAFDIEDGMAKRFTSARAGVKRTHVGVPLRINGNASDMLIVEGLKGRVKAADLTFLEGAALIVAKLTGEVVDAEHAKRRMDQIRAFADIGQVMAKTASKDAMLNNLASAIAAAAQFDAVAIAAFDREGKRVAHHALNDYRFTDHTVSDGYRNGLFDRNLLEVGNRREPLILRDIATGEDESLQETERRVLTEVAFFASLATLPLVVREDLIGTISFCSFTPHSFDESEMALLNSLSSQAAIIIKGLDLYEELRVSNEKLEEYAERLRESMSVEHRIARTDFLTGLPNRRYLEELLEGQAISLERERALFLMIADVDDFKAFNDRFGHGFGDDVLRLMGALARKVCGDGDIAVRYAGDEFLFVLPGRTPGRARALAERFRRQVEATPLLGPDGEVLSLTVSIGLAGTSRLDACTPAEALRLADAAMYEAKAGGGNAVSMSKECSSRRATTAASA